MDDHPVAHPHGRVCDLAAMSMVNRQLRLLAWKQETTDERPIFTEQEGVWEVFRYGSSCGSGADEPDKLRADGGDRTH